MFIILLVLLISLIFVLFLHMMNYLLYNKMMNDSRVSSFESGFCSLGKIQTSFSVHYFIIMLMFIIFDLELVLFMGVLVSDLNCFNSVFLILMFVLITFYMEWFYGKLIWVV